MKSVSAALREALRNGSTLDAQPRLIAEWNQNRYAGIKIVDNDPTDPSRFDSSVVVDSSAPVPEYEFPVSSIVSPNRPTRGIIKARTSTYVPTQQYYSPTDPHHGEEGFTAPDYSDRQEDARYYTVGPDAKYKYWTSPSPSIGGGIFPLGSEVRPYVLYKNLCWTNKIVITFENTWASPTSWQIQVTTSDTNNGWTTIANNPAIDSRGQVTLYRQASGTWGTSVYRDAPVQIKGMRIVVNSIDKSSAHLSLIEMSPRLESDLSKHLISYSTNFDMSDNNFITPLGKASANTGEISLSNLPEPGVELGLFNKDNESSLYYGLIDHNVKMTLDIGYLIGGTREYVREFEMYSNEWGGEGEESVTVPLKDSSKFMQEMNSPKFFLQGVTIGEAVWRICDMIGFTRYVYDKKDLDPATIIPYFWSDGAETVWTMFQQISEATQTAIYIDEFGYLQIKTRDSAYDTTQAVGWTLTAEDLPGANADIVELSKSNDFEANTVNISYKKTTAGEDQNGFPKQDIVWQPEQDFALRAANLTENMNGTQTYIRMSSENALLWPYEGIMTVDGEIVRYKGKEYNYYSKDGGTVTVYVNSLDEKNNIDRNLSNRNLVWKNSFTGKFNVTKRGEMQTSARAHNVTASGFSGRRHTTDSTATESWAGSFTHNRQESLIRVTTPANWPQNMYYTLTTGATSDPKFVHYGTSMRIVKNGSLRGSAGMVICMGAADSGYYIEVIRSTILNDNATSRTINNEINVGVRRTNGTFTRVGPNKGVGTPWQVSEDVWVDLDITCVEYNASHYIDVYVNGVHVQNVVMAGANKLANSGQFGLYGRGPGSVTEYDYLYAFHQTEGVGTPDQSGYLDKVRGGYVSNQWNQYLRSSIGPWHQKQSAIIADYDLYYYQDFGPVIHELREMSVTFEKYPVIAARLYSSNDFQAQCPQFYNDAFGAKFIIMNTHRETAILEGEDMLTLGQESGAVTHHLLIYGRVVFQEDAEIYTVKDDDGVYRRGVVAVDFDSKWIQSKAAAISLGDWIVKHWSGGNDEVEIKAFGNPLFQLGDLVAVHSPDHDMYQDSHFYFVVGIKDSFEQGLVTDLTLRRAKI